MRVGFGMTLVNRCLQGGGLDGIGNYTVELLRSFRERADVELFPYSFGLAPGDWPSLGINYPREQLQLPRYDVLAASSVLTHGLFPLTGELSKHVDLVHATDHLIYLPNDEEKRRRVTGARTLVGPSAVADTRPAGRVPGIRRQRAPGHAADHALRAHDRRGGARLDALPAGT